MKTLILSVIAFISLNHSAFADAYVCSTMPKNNPKSFKVMVYTYPSGQLFISDGGGQELPPENDFHCFPPANEHGIYVVKAGGGRRWGYEVRGIYSVSNSIGVNLYLEGPRSRPGQPSCRMIHLECDHSIERNHAPGASDPSSSPSYSPDPNYWPYSPTPNSAGYPS